MNLKKTIIEAIRSTITESDIKEAVYRIVSEEIDVEDALAESDILKSMVYDNLENAIEEELEVY